MFPRNADYTAGGIYKVGLGLLKWPTKRLTLRCVLHVSPLIFARVHYLALL